MMASPCISAGQIVKAALVLALVVCSGLGRIGDGAARNTGDEALPRAGLPPVQLHQNCPNPFNPRTVIPFSVDERTHVTLAVFDVHDRYLTTLIDRRMTPGSYSTDWDGRDRLGRAVGAGIYYFRLRTEKTFHERKAILAR